MREGTVDEVINNLNGTKSYVIKRSDGTIKKTAVSIESLTVFPEAKVELKPQLADLPGWASLKLGTWDAEDLTTVFNGFPNLKLEIKGEKLCFSGDLDRLGTALAGMKPRSQRVFSVGVDETGSFLSFYIKIEKPVNPYDGLSKTSVTKNVTQNDCIVLEEHPNYFLNKPENLGLLFDNAAHLISLFPTQTIVGLGQSPAWILEAAKIQDSNPERLKLVAFSGGWYGSDLRLDTAGKPKPDVVMLYREYLTTIGLSPQQIINNHSAANRLVIVEHTHSGKGLKSFLEILTDWAREDRYLNSLKSSLHVHLIVGEDMQSSHLPRVNPEDLFIRSIQMTQGSFVVDMSNSPDDLDRVVPHYAQHEWGRVDPSQEKFNADIVARIRFGLMAYNVPGFIG